MSSYAAIGAVSSTLRRLLMDRVDVPAGLPTKPSAIPVSIGLPPAEDDEVATPRLNLFLYRVTQNGFLANQEIPGRGASGAAYGRPPLALDLHYLLTPYGTSQSETVPPIADDSVAHFLLGSAMRVLHDFPIITETLETSAGAEVLDGVLRDAYERVKLTLEPLSLEDVAKVWTALNRPYRLSASYEVCVVQIETARGVPHPRPVGAPPPGGARATAVAAVSPRITEVHAAGRPGPYAAIGETLVLTGTDLLGEPTLVRIGGIDAAGAVTSARFDRVTVVVPDDPALQPGIVSLRILHGVQLGEPPLPHVGVRSNTAAFVLVPKIAALRARPGGLLEVTGSRLLTAAAECETLVGRRSVPSSAYEAGSDATRITFARPAAAVAGEIVRVRVNGAESLDPVTLP